MPSSKQSPNTVSKATRNRRRLAAETNKLGVPADFPCDYCISKDIPCLLNMSRNSISCAACTARGRPCVSVSWDSLDKTRENMSKEISDHEKERDALFERLAELTARIERKRRVLNQANERARSKLNCLIDEMEADGEDISRTVLNAGALL